MDLILFHEELFQEYDFGKIIKIAHLKVKIESQQGEFIYNLAAESKILEFWFICSSCLNIIILLYDYHVK